MEIARPDAELVEHCNPVGTEFYRPPVCSGLANEKLDVFALGVIAFELLWRFETRKLSFSALVELRRVTAYRKRNRD